MRLGASAYLAQGSLAGPTFEASAAASATLAFTSLRIQEGSPSGARAAATAIVSAAASSGMSVVADVSPDTDRLPGDSPWEFLRSIGVARVRSRRRDSANACPGASQNRGESASARTKRGFD